MATDPEYKADQKQSHHEWLRANPGYWRSYRRRHPEKVERNRALQIIRNRRRRRPEGSTAQMALPVIAKMDASKRNDFGLVGRFWLVPVIAKMDALKIVLRQISAGYD
jgi:hypothetical protein